MLSIEELGYFLYMEECEREQEQKEELAAAHIKYQVNSYGLLVSECGSQKEKQR